MAATSMYSPKPCQCGRRNNLRPIFLGVACRIVAPHLVADLELGHRGAALRDNARQFMAGHARVPVGEPVPDPGRGSRKNGRGDL